MLRRPSLKMPSEEEAFDLVSYALSDDKMPEQSNPSDSNPGLETDEQEHKECR